jgi:hypothetical protein
MTEPGIECYFVRSDWPTLAKPPAVQTSAWVLFFAGPAIKGTPLLFENDEVVLRHEMLDA